jgi:hypothetical protein
MRCSSVRTSARAEDIFVTNDVNAFGSEGSEQRQRMNALAPQTQIMTLTEFERFCAAQRRHE